ncbi:hypothetical protein LJC25_05345 [Bacteroidales bacterium OttesenSCG-928-K03]|nr:hypothetical protein [Odoribacter sp. OttesenSCG-928-L07]MDL2238996.1 hypothetical protein [Bacteroidales bacterium OttesenSCG-928-L14]MDL2240716.1 hypothetical protein [Bacteroidales bacterium OttesenSCG-928-K22]MDL2243132.1 hypothetical protein [Bacteroidales bacterium OttesenSCG-928-K03]
MEKKLALLATIIVAMTILLVGCTKEDPRDQYVGSYNETAVGTLTTVINGMNYTLTQDFSGTYQISKGSSENSLIKIEGSKSLNGVFADPSVTFETETLTTPGVEGESLQLTIIMTGTFSTNIFVTTRKVTGTYFYGGSAFPVTGTITGNATKL